MKRILFLATLVVIGTALVCGGFFVYLNWFAVPSAGPGDEACRPMALTPIPDVDALAKRMSHDQELYEKTRDEALANYARKYPVPHPYDEEARANLRLFAYLCIWGDYYGEGLWQRLSKHSDNLLREGNKDPIWQACFNVEVFRDDIYGSVADAQSTNNEMARLAKAGYPALFNFVAYTTNIHNLVTTRTNTDPDPSLSKSLERLPEFVSLALAAYQSLIAVHPSHTLLYSLGSRLLDAAQDDEPSLKAVNKGIDQAFATEDHDNPVAVVLDAQFYVDDAWNARGSGWASTVTKEGWQLLHDRLTVADRMLNEFDAKYPDETMSSIVRMTVILGLEQPREQMEACFQRGLKADPDNFKLYVQKSYYLLPRWYGSDEDLLNFGLECAASNNWKAKVPTMLLDNMDKVAKDKLSLYAEPEYWVPVEKIFRTYLEHYPFASTFRSRFVRCAVSGGHWDVAAEQLKILGDDWDRAIFKKDSYAQIAKLIGDHASSSH